MSRIARIQSSTGIYHVVLRAINRQNIFEDDDDRNAFLRILAKGKEKSGLTLHCYCLMDNHIHLLIAPEEGSLGKTMMGIAVSYAMRFNTKYERSGHLFQDRFKSEAIEDDSYLLAATRYICQNPCKAKLCIRPEDYKWSSCKDYLGLGQGLTDTELVSRMLGVARTNRKSILKCFFEETTDGVFLEYNTGRKWDSDLKMALFELCACTNATEFQALSDSVRDSSLRQLKEEGFSLRQISRVTGVPLGIVRSR